jgi:hypothetical protein
MSINGLTLAVPNQAHQIQHYSRYILILCIPRTRAPRGFSRIAWWFEAVRDWRWPLGVNHYAQNTQVMQPPQLQARQIAREKCAPLWRESDIQHILWRHLISIGQGREPTLPIGGHQLSGRSSRRSPILQDTGVGLKRESLATPKSYKRDLARRRRHCDHCSSRSMTSRSNVLKPRDS